MSKTLKTLGLAFALSLCCGMPAFAQNVVCSEPIAPAPIDGATATHTQMAAASHDANVFMSAAGDYQACLALNFQNQAAAAQQAKTPLDPSIAQDVDKKQQAMQALKEKIGKEFQDALAAYKQKHPGG